MYPDAYRYSPVAGEPGVSRKLLGVFTERELEIGFLRLEPRATHHFDGGSAGDRLFYVSSGQGQVDGHAWRPGDVMHLGAAERARLVAETDTEFYYLRLPTRMGRGD
jgi:hypothetical protein